MTKNEALPHKVILSKKITLTDKFKNRLEIEKQNYINFFIKFMDDFCLNLTGQSCNWTENEKIEFAQNYLEINYPIYKFDKEFSNV